MAGKVIVQFTEKVPPYNTGETAGFTEDEAQRLYGLRVAIPAAAAPDGPPVDKMVGAAPVRKARKRP